MRGIIVKLILLILGGGVFFVSNLEDRPTQKIPPPEGVFTVWISFVATPDGGTGGGVRGDVRTEKKEKRRGRGRRRRRGASNLILNWD